MKKSLLAVAAIGAFASSAQAQSSVTVYGILDVGFIGGNTTASKSSNPTVSGAPGTVKATGNQFGQSAESTSRLGFKGNEDLGNGMSAVFTAEFALAPADATLSGNPGTTTTGTSNLGLQNRQTFVGLKKNGVGTAAIGTQYTPIHNAVAATDPGQANNIAGNVVYAASSGPAKPSSTTAQGDTVGYTVRQSNSLTLASDTLAGFQVNGMLVWNNKNSTEYAPIGAAATAATLAGTTGYAGGTANTNGWGLGVNYTWQKLYLTANYQALKQVTTGMTAGEGQIFNAAGPGLVAVVPNGAGVAATTAGNALITSTAVGAGIQDNQAYIAGTYDFGILKAYAQWLNRKATSTVDTGYYAKRSAEQIGVRSFITPAVEAWASAGLGRVTAFGVNQPTANFNAWQLGSNYYLSKRTNLYAIYGATTTSNYAVSGVTASNSAQNYAIGVRHTF